MEPEKTERSEELLQFYLQIYTNGNPNSASKTEISLFLEHYIQKLQMRLTAALKRFQNISAKT